MNLRLGSIDDIDKIAMLIAQFRVELKQLKGIQAKPNLEQAVEEFREYLEAKYPIFAAEENETLLGYIVCRVDSGVVWAESLYVSQEARRKGVASRLYEKAEELTREHGGDTVYNWVHPNNDKMIKFLTKRGYDVLNLIEIRKPMKNEDLKQRIKVGEHEYRY